MRDDGKYVQVSAGSGDATRIDIGQLEQLPAVAGRVLESVDLDPNEVVALIADLAEELTKTDLYRALKVFRQREAEGLFDDL